MKSGGDVEFAINQQSLKKLISQLKEIPKKVGNKIGKEATKGAAQEFLRTTKPEIPVVSGKTAAALKIRAGKRKKGTISTRLIIGKGFYKGPQFAAAFVHFGHRVGSRKLGNSRVLVPANPFMHRGYEKGKRSARAIAIKILILGIKKATAK